MGEQQVRPGDAGVERVHGKPQPRGAARPAPLDQVPGRGALDRVVHQRDDVGEAEDGAGGVVGGAGEPERGRGWWW